SAGQYLRRLRSALRKVRAARVSDSRFARSNRLGAFGKPAAVELSHLVPRQSVDRHDSDRNMLRRNLLFAMGTKLALVRLRTAYDGSPMFLNAQAIDHAECGGLEDTGEGGQD